MGWGVNKTKKKNKNNLFSAQSCRPTGLWGISGLNVRQTWGYFVFPSRAGGEAAGLHTHCVMVLTSATSASCHCPLHPDEKSNKHPQNSFFFSGRVSEFPHIHVDRHQSPQMSRCGLTSGAMCGGGVGWWRRRWVGVTECRGCEDKGFYPPWRVEINTMLSWSCSW